MNREYFKGNEDNDYTMLKNFNNIVKLFDNVERCSEKNVIDATASRNDKSFNIELKMRYVDINKYDSIFIEPNKVCVLLLDYLTKGIIPLYINFFQTENTIAIWNLARITTYGYNPSVRINDLGYETYKNESRILLYTRDACIYTRDNNEEPYKLIKPSYLQ